MQCSNCKYAPILGRRLMGRRVEQGPNKPPPKWEPRRARTTEAVSASRIKNSVQRCPYLLGGRGAAKCRTAMFTVVVATRQGDGPPAGIIYGNITFCISPVVLRPKYCIKSGSFFGDLFILILYPKFHYTIITFDPYLCRLVYLYIQKLYIKSYYTIITFE